MSVSVRGKCEKREANRRQWRRDLKFLSVAKLTDYADKNLFATPVKIYFEGYGRYSLLLYLFARFRVPLVPSGALT